jgi:glycosyltransferase involved in cell wall biosynthesis
MDLNKNKTRTVSILVPCRNEARAIERCIENLYAFASPEGGFEVIVIDGMSDDGTREILQTLQQRYSNLTVLDNPARFVSSGMNLGIAQALGEYIVRADVRCLHPPTYLLDLLALHQKTGADNVGGVLIPISEDRYIPKSIRLSYKSKIAMGGALRDRGDFEGETDTVYGGCFKKETLLKIGLYDCEMVRNQDDELSFRLRKAGGKIIQSGRIKVQYAPRGTYSQLYKQFSQYGYWKVAVIQKHPNQASLRHFLPLGLVVGFITLSASVPFCTGSALWLIGYTAFYLLAIFGESVRISAQYGMVFAPGIGVAIFLIHIGFGLGFFFGILNRLMKRTPAYFKTLSR